MRSSAVLSVAALATVLAACGGSGGDSDDDSSVWHFRAVNAIADAPNVQFSIDGTVVANADYGTATAYHPAHTGTRPLQLAVRNPSNLSGTDPDFTNIGASDNFDFQGPTDYTLITSGTVADPRKFLITDTSRDAVEDNEVNYQVINAAVAAGILDVYVTAPEAGIAAPQQVGQLDLGEFSTATDLTVAAATGAADDATRNVNITVEVRDATTTVVYRSSALSIAEKSRVLFVIADNIGPPNVAPVKIFAVSDIAAGAAATLLDPTDGTELRFANVSPDAGPLDLINIETLPADVFTDIDFGEQSLYGPLAVDTFNSIATPTGNASAFLFVNNFTTIAGRSTTLYAQGPLASIRGLLVPDDRRSVPTEAHFRFLHAAPSEAGGALDIYIVPDGTTLDLNATSPPSPNDADVPYRGLSDSFVLDQGAYDVYFARANATSVLLGPVDLALTDGSVQTLVLADDPLLGTLTLLPVDDARP